MAYYEISRNPQLTLTELRETLRGQMPAGAGTVSNNYLTYQDGGMAGVRISLMQISDATLLRAQIMLGRMNPFLWLFLRIFPPALILYFLLLPTIARQGLLGEVERAILAAYPGSVRLPVGAGTRRARPGLYRFLGFLKVLAGLIVAAVGLALSRFWFDTPGLAPAQLAGAAAVAALGLSLAYAGIRNMASLALDLRGFAASVFVCAISSPFLFRAFWRYDERSWWKRVEADTAALYDYRNLPRGLWRADYCLRLARWRSDQGIREKLVYDFIKEDLELVVGVIDKFHPDSQAYQPAYRLAKSTLAKLDTH